MKVWFLISCQPGSVTLTDRSVHGSATLRCNKHEISCVLHVIRLKDVTGVRTDHVANMAPESASRLQLAKPTAEYKVSAGRAILDLRGEVWCLLIVHSEKILRLPVLSLFSLSMPSCMPSLRMSLQNCLLKTLMLDLRLYLFDSSGSVLCSLDFNRRRFMSQKRLS